MANCVPYSVYKKSEIEWLGAIPRHWNIVQLRHVLTGPLKNGLFKKKDRWGQGYKIVNVFDAYVNGDVVDENSLDRVICSESEFLKYSVQHGDFVFVRSSLKLDGIGKAAIVYDPTEPLVFECHLVRGRPDISKVDPKFLCFFLNSDYSRNSLIAQSNQVTMTTLDQQKFQNLRISIPPLLEQQIIVRFLDYKTAQIDALIAKKEALLAKLAEKRTALIIHVATKGLDPSVPMKDSEVEWLGDVPAHWKVLPLKHAIMFQRGHDLPAGDRIEGDIPSVPSAGISSCHDRAMAKGPGIVTGRYGTIGNFTYVQSDYWPLNTTLYSIKTHNNNEKYLWFMLHMLSGLFILNSKKGAVPGIDRNDLHPVLTVMPLRSEQDVIAEYLEKTTLAIDLHANLIRKTIEKLIEYRSSLITNAVTGKIDVRQFALPTAEQEATHA